MTEELAPGVRVPALAHTVGRLRPSVARELALTKHGLSLVSPEVRVFAPQPDGRAVTLWADLGKSVEAIRAWSEDDATAFVEFDRGVRALARFLADLGDEAPPEIHAPGFGDALVGLRLGRAFRGLGKADGHTILRVLAMAVADYVGESFRSEAVRATLAWRGVRYTAMGPWSAGTTAVLLADSAGNDGGAAGETVFAKGGPSAVADALSSAAQAAGAEIRTGARVVAITSTDGVATGVALDTGEEICRAHDRRRHRPEAAAHGPRRSGHARAVAALAGRQHPDAGDGREGQPRARRAPRRSRRRAATRGSSAAGSRSGRRRSTTSSAPSTRRSTGGSPNTAVLEATIPSLVDPSLVAGAKDGTHVMSVLVQWLPPTLGADDWANRRDEVGDLAIRTLETVAPGIGARVTSRQVLTPADLETEYGLTGGHPLHVEPGLDSFFLWRPLLGWARYRMPVDGLYLAGSGAHPGGGVTGAPGRNAAREVLADRKRRRR